MHLSKIGDIDIRPHREIVGVIKQVTITHMPSGHWCAPVAVDDGKDGGEVTLIEKAVGVDLGPEHYAVDSDGPEAENPRNLERELKKLRRDRRRLSRKKKGSKNREKQRLSQLAIMRTFGTG